MKKYLGLLVVLVALWLPRGSSLDRFVTPDEPKWLMRSANFYLALAQRDLASTFQKEHPGVTVMWAGMAGFLRAYPQYVKLGPGQMERPPQIERYLKNRQIEPLKVLEAGRSFVVAMIVITLSLAYLSAYRLIGFLPALIGFLLIAWDPFFIALSRLLHLDGLVSALMLLSLLAWLNYLYNGRRTIDLLLSAASAGLSWLTKSPALFLLPFLGFTCLIEIARSWRAQGHFPSNELWKLLKPAILWTVGATAVFVVFWPAMWVNPLGTLQDIFNSATMYAAEGHESAVFFNNNIYPAGIRDWSFYPINYFWRASPITLLGLIALIVVLFLPGNRKLPRQQRLTCLYLGLFVLLFTAFMTLGAKKFDRYLLPVFAPLDLLAGIGLASLASLLIQRPTDQSPQQKQLNWQFITGVVILASLTAIQAIIAWQTHPYYFSYYNLFAGGQAKAPQVMMIGWGEGLDEAARYINEKPDADKLKVLSWYADGPFSYLFDGETIEKDLPTSPDDLPKADYLVIYTHQWQRLLPSREFLDRFPPQDAEQVVPIDGLDYAWIYSLR